jgi:hypothetical protein
MAARKSRGRADKFRHDDADGFRQEWTRFENLKLSDEIPEYQRFDSRNLQISVPDLSLPLEAGVACRLNNPLKHQSVCLQIETADNARL